MADSRSSGDAAVGGKEDAGVVESVMEWIRSQDEERRIQAAREIRRLTKTSPRHRRQLSGTVDSLVSMLRSSSAESGEAALLALLNLSVKDERNKIKIVDAGALEPVVEFLQSRNYLLQEYATAAVLTMSASSVNKPKISASGAVPHLVKILKEGNSQSKLDALMALYNLSTIPDNLNIISSLRPVSPLINLLKSFKKSSKHAEKCAALLEPLMGFEEGRTALANEDGGVLTVVEMLEEGSRSGREHAVGALLTMCQSNCSRYRQVILKEGVIPGLLELTIRGTLKSQSKANLLLELLRNSPYHNRSELQVGTLENIVSNIVSKIDGDDRPGKAKKMLAEMVQVSMEQSLRHLQQRAFVCTPGDLSLINCPSKVSSKWQMN